MPCAKGWSGPRPPPCRRRAPSKRSGGPASSAFDRSCVLPRGMMGRGTVVQPPLVAKRVAMILYTCPGRELVVELHRAMISEAAIRSLRQAVGERNCITEPEQLRTYECDGLTSFRLTPAVVVLPETTAEVVEIVKVARAHGLPLVPRGSGTGLSGGALPVPGCVLVGLARMKRILEIDLPNGWMRVEPGVINLEVSRRLAPEGYYYAPDPSSQSVCSIGGNVAENSGGAHCLKYGFTVHHVVGLEAVLPNGEMVHLGGAALDTPGLDLVGVLVGSEGTLAVVTKVTLRLLRAPEAVRTLLAAFPSTEAAGNAVSEIIAAGIIPAAVEMMDRLTIAAAEAAVHPGFPAAEAVLIVELDGADAEVAALFRLVERICERAGATEMQVASGGAERARIWKGRKAAFAAMGRVSPNYYV